MPTELLQSGSIRIITHKNKKCNMSTLSIIFFIVPSISLVFQHHNSSFSTAIVSARFQRVYLVLGNHSL